MEKIVKRLEKRIANSTKKFKDKLNKPKITIEEKIIALCALNPTKYKYDFGDVSKKMVLLEKTGTKDSDVWKIVTSYSGTIKRDMEKALVGLYPNQYHYINKIVSNRKTGTYRRILKFEKKGGKTDESMFGLLYNNS
jgi:hypothetical protein